MELYRTTRIAALHRQGDLLIHTRPLSTAMAFLLSVPVLAWVTTSAPTSTHRTAPVVHARAVASSMVAFNEGLLDEQKLMSLTKAMREREMARDAAPVASEMEVVDLNRIARAAEMARDAATVAIEMEMIDLRSQLLKAQMEGVVAEMKLIDVKLQNEKLAKENDQLTSSVGRSMPGYYGMPFAHSLAHCVAHGRTAAIAARADLAWQVRRVCDRAHKAAADLVFHALVLRLRYAVRASKVLSTWKVERQAWVASRPAWVPTRLVSWLA